MFYLRGKAVAQNDEKAAKWFRLAAHQRLRQAEFNLSTLYYFGHGVPQNYPKAAFWARRAAHQGYAAAKIILASSTPRVRACL
jgi:TPR repeat protein